MKETKALKLSEKAGIQFSLTFLIQILGTVIIAVWGYSQLDARISQVQNETATHKEKLNQFRVTTYRILSSSLTSGRLESLKTA